MSAGGGSIKFWEYHGSIAGLICHGPVDTLEEIIVDGEAAWKGPLARGAATNYTSITIDARRVVRFYWGTETQTTDPLLQAAGNEYGQAHPSYKGICYIVLVDFFFGRERTSVPNIEVIVSRSPQQTVFASGAAGLHDGQASALATLGDLYTHPRYGLGLSPTRFDGGSWFDTADALYLGGVDRQTYLSPLLNQQVPARQAAAEMSLSTDLWLRFNPVSEKIEAGVFPHDPTIDVESLPLLTADDLTERPKFEGTGWGEMETGWAVTFTDRDRGFKETSERHDDLRALRIVGDHRRATLKRPWITRRDQAFFHATEYGKNAAQPAIKGQLVVRRAKAMAIRPGDLIRVDLDPEPGGTQMRQVCRVTERTLPQTGPIKLRVEVETSLAPVIFTPASDLPDTPQQTAVPELLHARIFELPAPLVQSGLEVGVLAERPHGMVTGLNVHYDSAATGTFQLLGIQEDFALRARPSSNWDASTSGPFPIEILSTRDLDLLDDDPGATAARDNRLLMICVETDGAGGIAEDASGFPLLEIISIEAFNLTAPNQFDVSGFRGRFGTTSRAFDSATAEVWILPGFALKGFSHRDFSALQPLQQAGYFRLQPFTAFSQRELSDCADIPFTFPSALAYAPRVAFTEPATPPGAITFQGTVDDADGNLVNFSLLRRASSGAEETLLSIPLSPTGRYTFDHTASFTTSGNFAIIARAQDSSGRVSDAEVSIEIAVAGDTVATPVISPSGGFIVVPRSVTLTCATAGATIEFALVPLGTPAPASGWSTYAGAFLVDGNTRLWARATATGLTPSAYAKADFFQNDFENDGNGPIIP